MGGPGYGRRARSGPVAGLPPGGRLGRDTAVTRHHLDDLVHGARRDWFAWLGWAGLDWLLRNPPAQRPELGPPLDLERRAPRQPGRPQLGPQARGGLPG